MGWLSSPTPPPAPDYAAAARETAAGNADAMRSAVQANRVNQFTPYGSSTWTQRNVESFDDKGYQAALNDYNRALAANQADREYNQQGIRANPPPSSQTPGGFAGFGSSDGYDSSGIPGAANNAGFVPRSLTSVPNAPTREAFTTRNPDAGWTQTETLTPQAQAALDQQLALNQSFGEVANIGFNRARSTFENPELDISQLPQRAIGVGQTAQDAILARLNPQLQQQEEQLRTRLANQGITLGSDAYGREVTQQGQRANDLQLQAALQGINLDQANRASALQEQAYLQDRPLNLINALRSGNQVQSPQFQNFAQQGAAGGPNMLGAAQAQYGADIASYNAQQASSPLGGLLGLGGNVLGLGTSGGGTLGGNLLGGLFGMR